MTMEERRIHPVERAHPWRDIGDANVEPDFLWPESEETPCPVDKSRKLSKVDAKKYLQWIQSILPTFKKKDERLHCA